MAAGTLIVYDIVRAGIVVEETMVEPTATDGDYVPNDGKTFLYVINGSAAPITVTVDTPATVDGQALADLTVAAAATGDGDGLDKKFIGPFTGRSNQSNGSILVTCSAVTDVLIGAFRVSNP
jgi:hypothetical protein